MNLATDISYQLYYEVFEAPYSGNVSGLAKVNSSSISLALDIGAAEGKPTAVLNTTLSALVIGGFGTYRHTFINAGNVIKLQMPACPDCWRS